jgi:hypothetical protein
MKSLHDWIEVFRAGDYGEKGAYNARDLAEIAANYDPALHEAPVVIGHPRSDSPAYGWVEGLRAEGNVLKAKLKQLAQGFQDLVKSGQFKKRSIALYRNLQGRGLYLRHLGFLGAQAPEVKGLAPAFAEDPFSEHVEIDLNDSAAIKEQLKEWFAEEIEKWDLTPKGPELEDRSMATYRVAPPAMLENDPTWDEMMKVTGHNIDPQSVADLRRVREIQISTGLSFNEATNVMWHEKGSRE